MSMRAIDSFDEQGSSLAEAPQYEGTTDELTELGNAEHIARAHAGKILFVTSWEEFIVYDGACWQLDTSKTKATELAIDTIRKLHEEACARRDAACAEYELIEDKKSDEARAAEQRVKRAAARVHWYKTSMSNAKLGAALNLARSQPGLSCTHTDLDAHPFLFNVKNGTIDLQTGRLRPHDPRDLITKIANVSYNPRAACPQFDAFLTWAMRGDENLLGYLRRTAGYALTGTSREHILIFHHGDGKNGKSTYTKLLGKMMGAYCVAAPRGLLVARNNGAEPHPADLARLYGARLVLCAELQENQSLDESKLKDLTGGDVISVRRMHENFWDMTPTHTMSVHGNHKPVIKGTDGGIWRRIKMVPWLAIVDPSKVDAKLPEKLERELPGILAWAVRGCLEWLKHGLGEPPAVKEATEEFRTESDYFGEFLRSRCVFEPEARIARSKLRKEYEDWCDEVGAQPIGPRRIADRLKRSGITRTSVRAPTATGVIPVDGWKGVRIRTEFDVPVEEAAE